MAASFAHYASQYLTRHPRQEESALGSSHPMFFSFSTEGGSRAARGGVMSLQGDEFDLDDPHLLGLDDPYLRLDEETRPDDDEDANLSSSSSPKGWLAHLADSPSLHIPAHRPTHTPQSSSDSDTVPPANLFNHPPPLSLTESLLPRDGNARPLIEYTLPDPPPASFLHRLFPTTPPYTGSSRRIKHHDPLWTSLWLTGVTFCYVSAFVLLFTTHLPENVPGGTVLPYVTLKRAVPLLTLLAVGAAGLSYAHIFLMALFARPVLLATSLAVPLMLFIGAVWSFVGSFMWEASVPLQSGYTAQAEGTWGETTGLRLFSFFLLLLSIWKGRHILPALIPIAASLASRFNTPNQYQTLPTTATTTRRRGGQQQQQRRQTLLTTLSTAPHFAQIQRTTAALGLTSRVLALHPHLLALSPALLVGVVLGSVMFGVGIGRGVLGISKYALPGTGEGGWTRTLSISYISSTASVWVWSWAVARGVGRVVVGGVIGGWYFRGDDDADANTNTNTNTNMAYLNNATSHTRTLRAALYRALHPSLGTICLASMLTTSLTLFTSTLRLLLTLLQILSTVLPLVLPLRVMMVIAPFMRWIALLPVVGSVGRWMVGWVEGQGSGVGGGIGGVGAGGRWIVVYCALTGVGWAEGRTRVRGVVSGQEEKMKVGATVRAAAAATESAPATTKARAPPPPPPPPVLPSLSPPTLLALPAFLATYLFVAHTLRAPHEALALGVLAAAVAAGVGVACSGIWGDVTDTLYLCYCIDRVQGLKRRAEVWDTFEPGTNVEPASMGAAAAAAHHARSGRESLTSPPPLPSGSGAAAAASARFPKVPLADSMFSNLSSSQHHRHHHRRSSSILQDGSPEVLFSQELGIDGGDDDDMDPFDVSASRRGPGEDSDGDGMYEEGFFGAAAAPTPTAAAAAGSGATIPTPTPPKPPPPPQQQRHHAPAAAAHPNPNLNTLNVFAAPRSGAASPMPLPPFALTSPPNNHVSSDSTRWQQQHPTSRSPPSGMSSRSPPTALGLGRLAGKVSTTGTGATFANVARGYSGHHHHHHAGQVGGRGGHGLVGLARMSESAEMNVKSRFLVRPEPAGPARSVGGVEDYSFSDEEEQDRRLNDHGDDDEGASRKAAAAAVAAPDIDVDPFVEEEFGKTGTNTVLEESDSVDDDSPFGTASAARRSGRDDDDGGGGPFLPPGPTGKHQGKPGMEESGELFPGSGFFN